MIPDVAGTLRAPLPQINVRYGVAQSRRHLFHTMPAVYQRSPPTAFADLKVRQERVCARSAIDQHVARAQHHDERSRARKQ